MNQAIRTALRARPVVSVAIRFPFALLVSVLAILLSGYDGVSDHGDIRYQDDLDRDNTGKKVTVETLMSL